MNTYLLTKNCLTPLELLNLYYSDGKSTGKKENKLWQKMNSLLSWENVLLHGYQSDLCPMFYYIITSSFSTLDTEGLKGAMFRSKFLPDLILSKLKKMYQNSLVRNLILLEELKKVRHALKGEGVKMVVLKGGYLAENIYKSIACRPMSDLDIFIKDTHCFKSYKVLVNMGYRNVPDNPRNKMLHETFCKTVMGQNVIIEVHHKIVKDVFLTTFDKEDIWTCEYPPLEFHAVYLAWHAIRHGIIRLVWLCDLAELTKNTAGAVKWESAKEKSSKYNVQYQFMTFVHLASNLINPFLVNNDYISMSYPLRYISQSLFMGVQNKIKHNQNHKKLAFTLGTILMKKTDLKEFFFRYMRYRRLT